MNQETAPSFAIEKLYVKDISLEVPNAPEIFLERESPEIGIQLQTAVQGLGDDAFEVTLTVTVTAKLVEEQAEKTVFLVEVGQSGIFRVRNVPEENLTPLLSVACPNILFPYARECITSMVSRGTFPQLNLAPVNFDALFMSYLQQQSGEGEGAENHQDA